MSTSRRPAWTLVELLVVIVIIIVIAALAAAFMPRMSSQHRVTDAANTVQGWLLQAKIRAKRDQLATGLRLFVEPNTPGSVTSLQWIQQPEPFTGSSNFVTVNTTAGPKQVWENLGSLTATPIGNGQWNVRQDDANIDFTNSNPADPTGWLVQAGDSFSFNDGPAMLITAAALDQAVTNGVMYTVKLGTTNAGMQIGPTVNWKVFRRPYPLLGEPLLTMPGNCVLDTNLSGAGGAGFGSVLTASPAGAIANMPYRAAYDILFSPKGQIVGQTGLLVLWVRSEDKQFDRSGTVSLTPQIQAAGGTDDQALIGVRATTGDIAVADVNGSIGAGTAAYTPFYFLIQGR